MHAVDHDFGGARPAVVVGGHRHAVGAGREDGEQVALVQRQQAVVAEEIARLADRADDFVGIAAAVSPRRLLP
jgi:hypothetical protein